MSEDQPTDSPERHHGSVHLSKTGIRLPSPAAFPPAHTEPATSDAEVPAVEGGRDRTRHAALPAGKRWGWASVIAGVLSLTTPWLPFDRLVTAPGARLMLPFVGMLFAPLAIAFGVLGGARLQKGSMENRKMATAGVALGFFYIALLTGALLFVLATGTYS